MGTADCEGAVTYAGSLSRSIPCICGDRIGVTCWYDVIHCERTGAAVAAAAADARNETAACNGQFARVIPGSSALNDERCSRRHMDAGVVIPACERERGVILQNKRKGNARLDGYGGFPATACVRRDNAVDINSSLLPCSTVRGSFT